MVQFIARSLPRFRLHHWYRPLLRSWPHWPMAAGLLLCGVVNLVFALRHDSLPFTEFGQLLSLGDSLAVLGNTTQFLLGLALVLVGLGLIWRLAAAWSFAVLLLAVNVGVSIALAQWDVSLVFPALLLVALLAVRRHFHRQTRLANYTISLISIVSILAYGTFGSYLLGAGFHPPIEDLTAAFYFSIITIATVGYGDITPSTPETRLFVVSLLVVGLGVFATAIASVLGPGIASRLARLFDPVGGRMNLKNHIILAGEGSIANNTAHELADREIPFVQITTEDSKQIPPGRPEIRGDPTDEAVLQQAGIDKAQMVIAAGENDGDNAFISLLAKDLNPRVRVLVVANSIRAIRRLKLAHADLVFAPAVVGGRLLADLVEGDQISPEFRDLLEGHPRRPKIRD